MSRRRVVTAAAIGLAAATVAVLAGCESDAHTVSDNLSKDAESFLITRDIVFYNGITDKYIAEVQGRCSVDTQDGLPGNALAVTCEVGPGQYTKDYLGLSDNVTWFAMQIGTDPVSPYRHTIIFKPEALIPNAQIEMGPRP